MATRGVDHWEWPHAVTLLCGHPCCLKSTVTRKLSFAFEVFALKSNETGPIRAQWGQPYLKQRSERYENLFRITEAVLQTKIPLLIDGTFENRRERTRLAALAAKYDYPLLVAYCYASDSDAIASRFAHRFAKGYGPDHRAASPAIYFDSLKRFTRVNAAEESKYDAFVEIDSTSKVITKVALKHKNWLEVMKRIELAYKGIDW